MNTGRILFDAAPVLSIGDKAALALTTLVLGMLTVFSVLLIIMIVLYVIGAFFKKKDQKAKKQTSVTPAAPAQPEIIETKEEAEDEGQIVAAITAAVAMCMDEPVGSFRVVSFKKTAAKPSWTKK